MNTVNVLSSSEDITDAVLELANGNSLPTTSLDTWTDVDTNLEDDASHAPSSSEETRSRPHIAFVSGTVLFLMSAIIFIVLMFQSTETAPERADSKVKTHRRTKAPMVPPLRNLPQHHNPVRRKDATTNTAATRKAVEKPPKNRVTGTQKPKNPIRRDSLNAKSTPEVTTPPILEPQPPVQISEAPPKTQSIQPNVTVDGDAKRVWLVSSQGTFGPGTVPTGTYKIKVLFSGKEPMEVGEFT